MNERSSTRCRRCGHIIYANISRELGICSPCEKELEASKPGYRKRSAKARRAAAYPRKRTSVKLQLSRRSGTRRVFDPFHIVLPRWIVEEAKLAAGERLHVRLDEGGRIVLERVAPEERARPLSPRGPAVDDRDVIVDEGRAGPPHGRRGPGRAVAGGKWVTLPDVVRSNVAKWFNILRPKKILPGFEVEVTGVRGDPGFVKLFRDLCSSADDGVPMQR